MEDPKSQEAIEQIRAKVLQAEQERLGSASTISISEARSKLRDRISTSENF